MRELILTLFVLMFLAVLALPIWLVIRQHQRDTERRRRAEAIRRRYHN